MLRPHARFTNEPLTPASISLANLPTPLPILAGTESFFLGGIGATCIDGAGDGIAFDGFGGGGSGFGGGGGFGFGFGGGLIFFARRLPLQGPRRRSGAPGCG